MSVDQSVNGMNALADKLETLANTDSCEATLVRPDFVFDEDEPIQG